MPSTWASTCGSSRSYEGAALATLVTNALVIAVIWVPLRRLGVVNPLPLRNLALALAGGLAAIGAGVATWMVAPWPVAALAAAGAFGGFTYGAHAAGWGAARAVGD